MTTPGVGAPDGAYVVGSRYGQDVPKTESGVMALAKGQTTGPWQGAQNKFRINIQNPLQQQQTELAGLQSRTQKLEGVIGYAHAYANGGISMALGSVKYPMSNQIGPVVGATMTNGSFILGSKGLWVADGQATFDFLNIGVKRISMTLKVYAPNGTEHFKRTSLFDTGEQNTRSVHMPFTVPSAGYYVELWVNAAIGRGVFGGSEWNGLSVTKISTEEN